MRLFETCQARLGLAPHQVRYENVVANLEHEALGLAAFLDVPFEAAMLNYRATAMKRHVATPSARQVIQPLYNRSIGRWRRYANELAPALPTLAPWVAHFGYGVSGELGEMS
jgi:hypothetical protein